MSMMYEILTLAKDWLIELAGTDQKEESEEEMKHRLEQEDISRREAIRRMGTAVTVESFAAWKEQYDAERALERAKLMDTRTEGEKAKRMTGRKIFESMHDKDGEGEDAEAAALEAELLAMGEDEEGLDLDEDFLDEYDLGDDDEIDNDDDDDYDDDIE